MAKEQKKPTLSSVQKNIFDIVELWKTQKILPSDDELMEKYSMLFNYRGNLPTETISDVCDCQIHQKVDQQEGGGGGGGAMVENPSKSPRKKKIKKKKKKERGASSSSEREKKRMSEKRGGSLEYLQWLERYKARENLILWHEGIRAYIKPELSYSIPRNHERIRSSHRQAYIEMMYDQEKR